MFTDVIVVDWGARSSPWPVGLTSNAPWVAAGTAAGSVGLVGPHGLGDRRNHSTRHDTIRTVEGLLDGAAGRTLLAVDSGFGYPAGFAEAVGLDGWRGVWDHLGTAVHDDDRNVNNRWEVAAAWNARLPGAGPFWGQPGAANAGVPAHSRGIDHRTLGFASRRRTELEVPRAQPMFKLAYPGSVGSQSLLAIAHLGWLAHRLGERARVWPFQAPPWPPDAVVIAEVYPSMFSPAGSTHPAAGEAETVIDAVQVLRACEAMRRLPDSAWNTRHLPPEAVKEEGWIAGRKLSPTGG